MNNEQQYKILYEQLLKISNNIENVISSINYLEDDLKQNFQIDGIGVEKKTLESIKNEIRDVSLELKKDIIPDISTRR